MNKIFRGSGGMGGGGSDPPTIDPDSLFSNDSVEITLGICEGPIYGLVDGAKTFYLDDTPLVSEAGSVNFQPFELHVYHGDADATPVKNKLGGISSSSTVNLPLTYNIPVVRNSPPELRNLIDYLEVRINIQQLFKTTDEGDQLEDTAEFTLEYRQVGESFWKPFYSSAYISISGKTTSGVVREFRKRVPRINGDYEIRVTRTRNDNDNKRILQMAWESNQFVLAEDRSYDNLAVVRGFGRASDQFSSIPAFSGVYGCKLIKVPSNYDPLTRHYDGFWDGTWQLALSDNPIWCLYDLFDDQIYGVRRHWPFLQLDRFSFYTAAKWCDELVPIPGTDPIQYQPRFTLNLKIEQQKNALEQAYYIAGLVGAVPLSNMNGSVKIKIDKPGDVVQVFAAESIVDGIFNYQFSDIADRKNDVQVSFINPNLGWQTDTRRVFDQDYIDLHGRNPFQMEAVGCHDPNEARRRAYRYMLQANTEITTVTFQTPRMGLALEIFDLIGVADPDMGWGVSARTIGVPVDNTVVFRDPVLESFPVEANTACELHVQSPTVIHTLAAERRPGFPDRVFITSGLWPTDATDDAQIVVTGGDLGEVQKFRVLQIQEDTENSELFTVTALEHNHAKFEMVDGIDTSGLDTKPLPGVVRPPKPTIKNLESGPFHAIVGPDGTIDTRMLVEIDIAPTPRRVRFFIYHRPVGAQEYTVVSSATRHLYISGLKPGVSYEVIAFAEYGDGMRSEQSDMAIHELAGRDLLPPAPTNWIGIAGVDNITLDGDPSDLPDFREFRFYGRTPFGDEMLGVNAGSRFVRTVPEGDTVESYYVTQVNTLGYESPATELIEVFPTGVSRDQLSESLKAEIDAALASADQAATAVAQVQGSAQLAGLALAEALAARAQMAEEVSLTRQSVGDVEASILTQVYTIAEADLAIASRIEEFAATFDPTTELDAKVTLNTSVLAQLNGSVARFAALTSVNGGQQAAGIEVMSWDTEGEGTGSLVSLIGDNVIAPGTLSTNKLIVGLGRNLLTNTNFVMGAAGWGRSGVDPADSETNFTVHGKAQPYAGPTYPTLRLNQLNAEQSGYSQIESRLVNPDGTTDKRHVPVTPGQWFEVSARVATVGCEAQLQLVYYNAVGSPVGLPFTMSVPNQVVNASNPESWPRYVARGMAPPTAAYAQFVLKKNPTISPATTSDLYLYKPQLAETHANATTAVPYNPDGTTMIDGGSIIADTITGDKISANAITAGSAIIGEGAITNAMIADAAIDSAKIGDAVITNAKIGNAEVNTLKIAGKSVTVFRFAVGSGASISFSLSDPSSSVMVLASVTVSARGSSDRSSSTDAILYFNGNVLRRHVAVAYSNSNTIDYGHTSFVEVLPAGASGTLKINGTGTLIIGEFKR